MPEHSGTALHSYHTHSPSTSEPDTPGCCIPVIGGSLLHRLALPACQCHKERACMPAPPAPLSAQWLRPSVRAASRYTSRLKVTSDHISPDHMSALANNSMHHVLFCQRMDAQTSNSSLHLLPSQLRAPGRHLCHMPACRMQSIGGFARLAVGDEAMTGVKQLSALNACAVLDE